MEGFVKFAKLLAKEFGVDLRQVLAHTLERDASAEPHTVITTHAERDQQKIDAVTRALAQGIKEYKESSRQIFPIR
jgi:hypothetical protein